jgi:DNA adenine methylase
VTYYSPLRYPGGKGKFSRSIESILEENNLLDCTYIEPFCGGAAVAWSLLLEGFAKKVIVNDYDPAIYHFWFSVIYYTDELLKQINDAPLTVKSWERAKQIHLNSNSHSIVDVGFATFFLNRVNRSGIIKGGIIGGRSQSGLWRMDARFNKSDLSQRIITIARASSRIVLLNMDAVDCVKSLSLSSYQKPFIYFDPPYYRKADKLYLNYFKHADHLRIADFIKSLEAYSWITSYDDCPEIRKMYSFAKRRRYHLNYSAGNGPSIGSEVLFTSNNIKVPDRYFSK